MNPRDFEMDALECEMADFSVRSGLLLSARFGGLPWFEELADRASSFSFWAPQCGPSGPIQCPTGCGSGPKARNVTAQAKAMVAVRKDRAEAWVRIVVIQSRPEKAGIATVPAPCCAALLALQHRSAAFMPQQRTKSHRLRKSLALRTVVHCCGLKSALRFCWKSNSLSPSLVFTHKHPALWNCAAHLVRHRSIRDCFNSFVPNESGTGNHHSKNCGADFVVGTSGVICRISMRPM